MDLTKLYNLLYKSFVAVNRPNKTLESIKHEKGKIYASDGAIVAIVECNYPEEREGKSLLKSGEELENNIKYESVIPPSYTDDIQFTNRVDDLRVAVKKVYRLGIKEDKAVIDSGLTKETGSDAPMKVTFAAFKLFAAFQLFDLIGEDFTIRVSSGSMRAMMIESLYSETKVLIMPIWAPFDKESCPRPTFTIEEALNYKPEVKSENKAWYEKEV